MWPDLSKSHLKNILEKEKTDEEDQLIVYKDKLAKRL